MIRVSFAYTWDAIKKQIKTETRRDWKPSHAAKFKPIPLPFLGIEKLYKKNVETVPLICLFVYRERLGDMSDESFEREAVKECGLFDTKDEMIEKMGGPEKVLYVMRFDYEVQDE